MPKMVPFTTFCWRRRTPPRQWRYPCLCRQNGVGTSPPPTLTRPTYFKRFHLHRLNYNSLSVKQQSCFTMPTTERKLQYSSIRGWVVAISLLKIWSRPPSWIWPKVDFHNILGTALHEAFQFCSVVTHLKGGGKYGMGFVANFTENMTIGLHCKVINELIAAYTLLTL